MATHTTNRGGVIVIDNCEICDLPIFQEEPACVHDEHWCHVSCVKKDMDEAVFFGERDKGYGGVIVKTMAALFVQSDGCYPEIDFIDAWPESRDARKYNLNLPVIAHPPCQRWGKMAKVNYARWGGEHNRLGNDGGCFKSALESVNRCGGVLEHPAQTYAWSEFELKKPIKGQWIKSDKGWTCEVWQSAYKHKANKATWLYYVGNNKPFDLNWNRPKGSHQIGHFDRRGKDKNKPTLSKFEANATPEEFKQVLIRLAKYSSSSKSNADID